MRSGAVSLGSFSITTAGTQTGEWIEDFDGLLALLAQLKLSYGGGGTSIKAYLQTAIDGVPTPIDIACVVFGILSENAVLNFSALTPKTQVTPADGALADDSVVDGVLGSQFRLKVVSTGTYSGSTTLSATVQAR